MQFVVHEIENWRAGGGNQTVDFYAPSYQFSTYYSQAYTDKNTRTAIFAGPCPIS